MSLRWDVVMFLSLSHNFGRAQLMQSRFLNSPASRFRVAPALDYIATASLVDVHVQPASNFTTSSASSPPATISLPHNQHHILRHDAFCNRTKLGEVQEELCR